MGLPLYTIARFKRVIMSTTMLLLLLYAGNPNDGLLALKWPVTIMRAGNNFTRL